MLDYMRNGVHLGRLIDSERKRVYAYRQDQPRKLSMILLHSSVIRYCPVSFSISRRSGNPRTEASCLLTTHHCGHSLFVRVTTLPKRS
jgi:hypothetical protein